MKKLCCVRTRQQFSARLVYLVTSLPPYLHQFSTISGGNCIIIVALQHTFHVFYDFILALLRIPDRPVSLLGDSSLTYLVNCCFFCFHLFSCLDMSSLIPLYPPSFIIVYKHGSILCQSQQVTDPYTCALEVLCIMVSTKNTLSSFIRITIG